MKPRDPNLQDYQLEAAPEGTVGTENACGGFGGLVFEAPKYMTYDEVLAAAKKEPILQAIIDDRVSMLGGSLLGGDRRGYVVMQKEHVERVLEDLTADLGRELWKTSRMLVIDSVSKYERDPFWQQWQAMQAQLKDTEWKKPIIIDELPMVHADAARYDFKSIYEVECEVKSFEVFPDALAAAKVDEDADTDNAKRAEEMAYLQQTNEEIYLSYKRWLNSPSGAATAAQMSASEMDWDDEEEETQPGIGTGNLDVVAAPTATEFGYPRITTDGVGLTDRCYFCATKKNITRFMRSKLDHVTTCVFCLYDHLGWELTSDGQLRKVPAEI